MNLSTPYGDYETFVWYKDVWGVDHNNESCLTPEIIDFEPLFDKDDDFIQRSNVLAWIQQNKEEMYKELV